MLYAPPFVPPPPTTAPPLSHRRRRRLGELEHALQLVAGQVGQQRAELAPLLERHRARRLARPERPWGHARLEVVRRDVVAEHLALLLERALQLEPRDGVEVAAQRLRRELLLLQVDRPRLLELQRRPRLLEVVRQHRGGLADGVVRAVVEQRVGPDQPHVGGELAGVAVRARLEPLADRLQVHRRLDDQGVVGDAQAHVVDGPLEDLGALVAAAALEQLAALGPDLLAALLLLGEDALALGLGALGLGGGGGALVRRLGRDLARPGGDHRLDLALVRGEHLLVLRREAAQLAEQALGLRDGVGARRHGGCLLCFAARWCQISRDESGSADSTPMCYERALGKSHTSRPTLRRKVARSRCASRRCAAAAAACCCGERALLQRSRRLRAAMSAPGAAAEATSRPQSCP